MAWLTVPLQCMNFVPLSFSRHPNCTELSLNTLISKRSVSASEKTVPSKVVLFLLTLTIKKIDVSCSCVCPVIDHEFRHSIVKVDYFDSVMTKSIVNNRADA